MHELKSESSLPVMSDSQRPHGLQPTRLLRPWDFPGKSTGVGCHCLLQNESLVPVKEVTTFSRLSSLNKIQMQKIRMLTLKTTL